MVVTCVVAIYEDVGNTLHTAKAQKESLASPLGRYLQRVLVVGRGLAIEACVGRRLGVPSVRKGYLTGVVARILFGEKEFPIIVQNIDLSCGNG